MWYLEEFCSSVELLFSFCDPPNYSLSQSWPCKYNLVISSNSGHSFLFFQTQYTTTLGALNSHQPVKANAESRTKWPLSTSTKYCYAGPSPSSDVR